MLGNTALPSVAGLDLQAVDEHDHVVEAPASAGSNAASGNGDGQMGLAGAGAADQNSIALPDDETTAGAIIDQSLIDGGALELDDLNDLAARQLCDGEPALDR